MADEPKPSWWKSVPGTLTAATGFIAALSGLVAGINQLGVFRRESPAAQVVGTAAAPRHTGESTPPGRRAGDERSRLEHRPRADTRGSRPRPSVHQRIPTPCVTVETRTAPRERPAPRTRSGRRHRSGDTRAPAEGHDTRARGSLSNLRARIGPRSLHRSARGTGQGRRGHGLPANTTAVLRLRRGGSPPAPQVRLDSLVGRDLAVGAPSAEVRVRRSAVNGMCLRANARITATLGATLTWRRSPSDR